MDPAWIKKDFLHLRLDVAAVASQLEAEDRNRMRQKRFYHKRKAKMNELEYQVQSLIEEVERLKLEKSSLSTRHHFLTKIAEHREDQLQLLRESAQIKQTENSTPGCDSPTQSSVYGTAGPWRAQLYSVSDVLSMSSEELQKLCQDYIRKGELLSKWTTLVPDAPRLLLCTHLDAGALAELPPEWEARRQTESLLRKIEITDQQRGYILELHQKLRRNLECAKHKQRELSKELKLYLKSTEYIIAPRVLSGQPLELEDIIYKLKDAVSSQWEEWLYFLDAICHVVLSPLQVARMALCSYPYTPDMVGLALLIAEEEAAKIQ